MFANEGEKIAHYIYKEVGKFSFSEWCEDKGIDKMDFDEFIRAGVEHFKK